jgi:anaerobic sulfite reductase subunit A
MNDDFSKQRAVTYRLLSVLYLREVDEQTLEILKAVDYTVFDEDMDFDCGFNMLKDAINSSEPSLLLNLARDYARVFLGAGLARNSGAYPYESFYTSADHLLMQEARDDAVKFYHSEGWGKNSNFAEAEDHISFELGFMSKLCGTESETPEKSKELLQKQKDFFNKHIKVWVPHFVADLEKIAAEPFYKALALITKAFVEEENEYLNS